MRSLRVSIRDVRRILQRADQLELSRGACLRLRWFLHYLENGGSVSFTCRYFGIARSTFLRWAERFDSRDPQTLEEHSRRPHHVRPPETGKRTVQLIRAYREEQPLMNKEAIGEALRSEHSLTISDATVGRVIRRHGFFFADTPAHRTKRRSVETSTIEFADDRIVSDGAFLLPERALASRAQQPTATVRTDNTEKNEWGVYQGGDQLENNDEKYDDDKSCNDGKTTGGVLGMLAALGTVTLLAIPTAHAAESASYILYDEFSNYAERTAHESTNFQLNEAGVTWEQRPLVSTNFQIVAAPAGSSSSSSSSSSATAASQSADTGGGDGGGRRGHGTQRDGASRNRAERNETIHPAAPPVGPQRPWSMSNAFGKAGIARMRSAVEQRRTERLQKLQGNTPLRSTSLSAPRKLSATNTWMKSMRESLKKRVEQRLGRWNAHGLRADLLMNDPLQESPCLASLRALSAGDGRLCISSQLLVELVILLGLMFFILLGGHRMHRRASSQFSRARKQQNVKQRTPR